MAKPSAQQLRLKTGHLCLDFTNTVEWHASDHPEDHLGRYADLVAWAREVGLLAERQALHLRREASRRPEAAAAVLAEAVALREAVYRLLAGAAHGQAPAASDLATLNQGLTAALEHARVVPAAEAFAWDWAGDDRALDGMLWPIARSAAELLTSPELWRVGQCADDRGCGWLFWDRSKNRTRRWCSMRDCGNRAKANRFHQRQRKPPR